MQEEIKNSINDESKEKRKLNDAELAQVTGGARWDTCDHNCSKCYAICSNRSTEYNSNNMTN